MDSLKVDSINVDSDGQGLDGPAKSLGPTSRPSESANLGAIREAFRAFSEDGVTAGVDALLSHAHEDCQFRPYTAGEKVLKGPTRPARSSARRSRPERRSRSGPRPSKSAATRSW